MPPAWPEANSFAQGEAQDPTHPGGMEEEKDKGATWV